MAQRRMFSLSVVDTDRFLEMPQTSQNLYFHLGMRADDDGFVASPRKVIKIIGAAVDDLKLLTTKGYIIPFESGICVITDWKQNNYLRSDRYTETTYKDEKSLLSCDSNGSYTMCLPSGIPSDNQAVDERYTQDRLGKVSIGKDSKGESGDADAPQKFTSKKFVPPTLDEVKTYCQERKNRVDPQRFYDYFNASNWVDSKGNKVKNWKQKIITWEGNANGGNQQRDQAANISPGNPSNNRPKYGTVL